MLSSMKSTCARGHTIERKIEMKWEIPRLISFWGLREQTVNSPKSVMSCGPWYFYITLQSTGLMDKAYMLIQCDGNNKSDDFDCYLWAIQGFNCIGGHSIETILLNTATPIIFDYEISFNIFCKVIYKEECPICVANPLTEEEEAAVKSRLWESKCKQLEKQVSAQIARNRIMKDVNEHVRQEFDILKIKFADLTNRLNNRTPVSDSS
ncbi:hypothetical protein M3Y98_00875900 [Aphelenchoides besseyi]|nr:hypothetical protein M3Y98_00875900 [Aphelenchoides besseyi]KAI6195007.1 hypothetical protein M3Y96_01185400 [Aphelenchoides besseyi]